MKNCKSKFTECNSLTNEEFQAAFKQYQEIDDSKA